MAQEREVHVDRLIAFSDGVVAIAITLLILPLTEIHRGPDANVRQVVVENWNALFAFALSFAVIANYWTIHHDIFRPVRHHSPRLIQLNMLWLAAIVFMPFPAALIADGVDGGFGTLYIGTLLVVSLLNLAISRYLSRHPDLTDGKAVAESRNHAMQSAVAAAVLAVAGLVSIFFPTVGVFALFLLFPTLAIAGRRGAKLARASAEP
jgi:uncharacterized membrane protein